MTTEEAMSAPSILLSREELLAVLEPLGTAFIPGLDPDPLGDLTEEGWQLALLVARRALVARELARQGADGKWLVHQSLLETVGVCAQGQSAILAYHWTQGSETPHAFYGHLRDGRGVAHTRPSEILHRFTVLGPKAALVAAAIDFCACADRPAPPVKFIASTATLTEARALAAGDEASAAELLTKAGTPAGAAQGLAHSLSAQPEVSVIQVLRQQGDGTINTREATLIQDDAVAWWMEPSGEELTVRTVSLQQICDQIEAWL